MDKFRAVWEKVDAALFQILRHICAVILGALVAVVFYIFFGRYVLHNSPMWGEPFSLLCLVWLSLLGSVLVVRKNEHLAVTCLTKSWARPVCSSPTSCLLSVWWAFPSS